MTVLKQLISARKHFPYFCKLYSIQEENLEEILAENDVDSFVYHNFFISPGPTSIKKQVSKGSKEKRSPFILFQFCDLKPQLHYKMIKLPVHYCFGEIFHFLIPNSVSRPFNFKNLQKNTETKLFINIRLIHCAVKFSRMNIFCLN